MRKRMKLGRPSHGTVVAYLALFVALGGGAMAASHLGKNSVGTKQLKKNAVTGAKVKDGSLTGSDIKASTLGEVPSARHAASADSSGHAGDANTLDGNPAGAFVRGGGQLLSVRRELAIGDSVQLLTLPGLGTLSASCANGATKPKVDFSFNNSSGGTVDETLEYGGGTDAGTVPNGGTEGTGGETFLASRMKLASRTSPATLATIDFNMAAEGPSPCSLFVQAIVSE